MAAYDAGLHEAPDPVQRKDEEKLKKMMRYSDLCVLLGEDSGNSHKCD